MNLTLHLPSDLESKLREQAAALGKPPEVVALEAIRDVLALTPDAGELLSKDSRLAKFRELVASMPDGNPDADLSRDSAYGDRGR